MTPTIRFAATVALIVCACGDLAGPYRSPGATPTSGLGVEITIFAAASLHDALDRAQEAYEAANPGTTLRITTDSSAALATQIEQGAPADVFLSADTANPRRLVDGGFAEGQPVVFAGNLLTIVVPPDNPGDIRSWQDIARGRLRIIAAGEAVPITKYATQLVGNLAVRADAPPAFAEGYAANIVSREENVTALLAKIELGEGDAGIVYVTDAATSLVETIDLPTGANIPATYAGVVVKESEHGPAATAFLAWLAGPHGQDILAGFGFLPPPS